MFSFSAFWKSPVLAHAVSESRILHGTLVQEKCILHNESKDGATFLTKVM